MSFFCSRCSTVCPDWAGVYPEATATAIFTPQQSLTNKAVRKCGSSTLIETQRWDKTCKRGFCRSVLMTFLSFSQRFFFNCPLEVVTKELQARLSIGFFFSNYYYYYWQLPKTPFYPVLWDFRRRQMTNVAVRGCFASAVWFGEASPRWNKN